ncbi:hypothetical protein M2152_000939 [Microbacteriaceae bacterium SG_E_30_P1]|uniref:RelA/SpoT domain-containing protein n=1 Tax=Antiquaquibacter oligotrophicus TaxID=2880260 RepID=A0ABT6KL65_9MICO|nr:hypothetical protein [Antiquaquibacter oligotrophicus]
MQNSLRPSIPKTWHYEGRVKKPESYALKVETGRVDPRDLDDFFACTVVVPTLDSCDTAEALIARLFDVVGRKPETALVALSQPFDFQFDHIRLYARLRVPSGLDPAPVHRLRFEVQVKTFLQHAWSIATHDLTYKTNDVSWGKERVAAQVKASLEAAEVSIVEAERLATSGNKLLARQDSATASLVGVVGSLQRHFTAAQLPEDTKRLALTIKTTLEACSLEPGYLEKLLNLGKAKRMGSHPADLSPFGVVLLYLVDLQPAKLKAALRRAKGPKILISREVALPASFLSYDLPSARHI